MQGASPLASPRLDGARHWLSLPYRYPEAEPGRHRNRGGVSRAGGELAPALPADLAIAVPSGGRGGWGCRPTLPLACFVAPHPPDPLPRWGRGSHKVYFAGGFAPGTPALNRLRHRLNLPRRYPAGGLPSLSPPCPAFSLLCCPLSPPPSPVGKGEPQRLFRRGLRPRHSCAKPPAALTDRTEQVPGGLNPSGTGTGAAYRALAGGLPRRCRMTLPSLSPAGGAAVRVAALPCL